MLRKDLGYERLKTHMNIVEDEEGILRAKGRMQHACLPYDARAPVVLKKEHYLSQLIVLYCHSKVLHNGVKQTITEIWSYYWIEKIMWPETSLSAEAHIQIYSKRELARQGTRR